MKRHLLLPIALVVMMFVAACGEAPKEEPKAEAEAPAKVEAKEPIKLTYANFPPPFTIPCVQMEEWKKVVAERTDGQVQVETFPTGTLLKSKNMLRGVIEGQADIGCLSMSYQPGVFPLTTAVEMPLGFTSSKVASQVLFDLYQKYQPAEFSEVKVLTMFATPPTNVMSTVPVTSLEDMSGLELRGGGTPAKFLEMIGAAPVSMPMPETPDALQKNLVKGLFSSLEVMQDMKFADYCPYVTEVNGPVYIFAVIMNKAKYDALPDDVKQVFDTLAPEQAAWTGEYWDKHVVDALNWSKAEKGVTVHTLKSEDLAAIATRTAGITDAWKASASEAGVDAEAVLATVLELKAKYEN